MTQINIPSITIDTKIPYKLDLRAEGQPLHGLQLDPCYIQLTEIRISENYQQTNWNMSEMVGYTVRTVGLAPQTKRDKKFRIAERAEMVKYVNEWFAKTVAAGLKKLAEQRAMLDEGKRRRRESVTQLVEEAGGVEERRERIVQTAHGEAMKEAMQYQDADLYLAIFNALSTNTPINVSEATRARLLARQEEYFANSWHIKDRMAKQMQAVDEYVTWQEEATV